MHAIGSILRAIGSRLALLLVALALVGRVRSAWRRRRVAQAARREAARSVLPSLYDRHANASSAPRRRIGLTTVPVDRIVGTLRRPSQNTADFLPLPQLRGANWTARWARITRATDRLTTLPPVDLVKVGDEYWVADGHNRVAAARHVGMLDIDADVTEVVLPGQTPGPAAGHAGAVVEAEELRRAAVGRYSRTVEERLPVDGLSRRELAETPTLSDADALSDAARSDTDARPAREPDR